MSPSLRRLLLLFLLSESLSCHYDDIKVLLKWKNGGKGFAKEHLPLRIPTSKFLIQAQRRRGRNNRGTLGWVKNTSPTFLISFFLHFTIFSVADRALEGEDNELQNRQEGISSNLYFLKYISNVGNSLVRLHLARQENGGI